MERWDIAVVGAGPCGLGVGVAAREAGLRCVLFDRSCVASAIYGYPTHMTFFSTAEKIELGGLPLITAGDKPTRLDALKYYRRVVEHFGLDVRQYHDVQEVGGAQGEFFLTARGMDGSVTRHQADNLVLATGYFDTPNMLGIPGEDLPKVTHYYREPHPYYDQDCIVVGGGNSAVDAALELYRAGARVQLVHFAAELDSGVKPWVLPDILNRIRAGDIPVRWQSRLVEVRRGTVLVRSDKTGAVEEIPNDWVLAMTGYVPDPRLLRSLGASIEPASGIPRHDAATMETDVPGVFVAGVLAAGFDANKIFIENGREHGPRIVDAALKSRSAIPR